MNKNVIIIVVLYNNLPKDYTAILDRYNELRLLMVDNTPQRDLAIKGERVEYYPLGDNMGIAYALNFGCKLAIDYGAEWVLTLDQDSDIPINMIEEYQRFVATNTSLIGIVCPLINVYQGERKVISNTVEDIEYAITSGSFLNLKAYQAVGGFKNELFIDEVDFEYCLNLKSKGFLIKQLNYVLMQHQVGNTREYRLMGKHLFYVLHHSNLRHYYMQRNSLYVSKWYSETFPFVKQSLWRKMLPFIKIILFEKDKAKKIQYRLRGYRDFKKNIMGKYNYSN